MIYPSKIRAKRGKIRVKSLSGGVNLRENPTAVENEQCSKINNMWYKDGCLENRPALFINEENKLYDVDSSHAFFTEFEVFGSKIAPGNEFSRLAMANEFYDSMVRLKFFLIDDEATAKAVAGLDFTRASFDSFTLPHVNCAFYSESSEGSGIYIMVTMYNYESADNGAHVRFYELSDDHSVWNDVTEEKLYVPTVYVNGRGNNYGAMFEDNDYPEPQFAEPRSMLTGKFKCYFTTDGYSSVFRLPINKLDNETVTCRYENGDYSRVWTVEPNQTSSLPQKVVLSDVILYVDRNSGYLTFRTETGDAPLPVSCQNSLEITVSKTEPSYFEALKGSTAYCEYSSRMFVSGFQSDINGVYFSAQSNPFYFPQQNKLYLGSAAQKITALCVHGRLLIAFKENKTYSITSKSVQEYNLVNVIDGSEKVPTMSNVSYDTLSEEFGCDCIKTVRNCGNHLVWLSSRGAVCTIVVSNQYSKGNVYELSLNIEDFLKGMQKEKLKSAVAAVKDGYYIIFIGNKAIAMDYTAKGFRYVATCSDQRATRRSIYWYIWEFPNCIKFENTFSAGGDSVLICSRVDDECYWYGTAVLSGSVDTVPVGNFETLSLDNSEINCSVRTKSFDFDEAGVNKFLKKAYLSISGDSVAEICLYDGEELKDSKTVLLSGDKILTKELYFLNGLCREIALSVTSRGKTKICSLQLEAVITETSALG